MPDDLFFIPMIAKALRKPDPKAAMIDTFERIRAMGREPRYQRGYQQLIDFMDSAVTGRLEDAPEEVGALILDGLGREMSVEVIIERDNEVVATRSFKDAVGAHGVNDVKPGNYRLKLDTGRLLWEGQLTDDDLVWSKARPRQNLPVAADSEEIRRKPTREIDLLDGTAVLRVYPGVETGSLEIELKNARSDE